MGNLTWETFAKLVDLGDPRPSSAPARAVIFAYGFLLLICVNLYTATMAAKVGGGRRLLVGPACTFVAASLRPGDAAACRIHCPCNSALR